MTNVRSRSLRNEGGVARLLPGVNAQEAAPMNAHDPTPAPPPSGPPRFHGRAAVVTGGARGIGRAIAIALAREGCDLLIGDILEDLSEGAPYPKATQDDLDQTVAAAQACGVRCRGLRMDVREPQEGAALIQAAQADYGRLDFLVADAAVTLEGRLTDLPPEQFDAVVRTNLHGVFHVMAPGLRLMTQAGRGRVVAIGSGASKHAEAEAGPYVASKFGLVGLCKTAALEVAKSGVTVNVVLPGPTDTPMMSSLRRFREAVPDKPAPTREDYLEARKDATPMGLAWIKPEDVAAVVLFLLSDEARFISGETISVDAADCAHWT